jgi:phage regulator Rha-like protein
MSKSASATIHSVIRTIRGRKVILDTDLAAIYSVTTKRLNEQVKRNKSRFPEDFMFRLTAAEARKVIFSRSQIATLKRGQNIKHLPYAFTEHGAIMVATILSTPQAVKMSVFVVRAFVRMREQLTANAAILRRLAEIDRTLLLHDKDLSALWDRLQLLLEPPDDEAADESKTEIGFHVREKAARYTVKRTRKQR